MRMSHHTSRRALIKATAFLGDGIAATPLTFGEDLGMAQQKKEEEEEVPPAEDLMREHGVLKRVLLVYDEIVRRIAVNQDFSPRTVSDAANIIHSFVEQYHEKLEEDYLFPRFRKAGKL